MSSSSEYTKWIGGFAGFMYGGFLGAFIGSYMETKDIQYSGNVANYFSYVSVQQNNACLKFSSLLKTKNAAKAAFL